MSSVESYFLEFEDVELPPVKISDADAAIFQEFSQRFAEIEQLQKNRRTIAISWSVASSLVSLGGLAAFLVWRWADVQALFATMSGWIIALALTGFVLLVVVELFIVVVVGTTVVDDRLVNRLHPLQDALREKAGSDIVHHTTWRVFSEFHQQGNRYVNDTVGFLPTQVAYRLPENQESDDTI